MAFRFFVFILVLGNIFLLYSIYGLSRTRTALYTVPAAYSAGPADADLAVAEFFDYSCAPCRKIDPALKEALRKDGKIRYIPRPLASDKTSLQYARAFYAAGTQGKMIEMHEALIGDFHTLDAEEIAALAKTLGLDADKFNKDMASENIEKELKENLRLARSFGSPALPQFVMGGRIAYSPANNIPTVDDFLKMFNEARL